MLLLELSAAVITSDSCQGKERESSFVSPKPSVRVTSPASSPWEQKWDQEAGLSSV